MIRGACRLPRLDTAPIAARMDVALASLNVSVEAHAEVRGCLMVDCPVPAGLQSIDVDVRLVPAHGTDPARVKMLTSAAEECCVVLRTVRGDASVSTRFGEMAEDAIAG